MNSNELLNRRHFLRQSFAFSALAGVRRLPLSLLAQKNVRPNSAASHLLMVGDWGYGDLKAQASVAAGMQRYVGEYTLKTDALLMLGDNWYGTLQGGVDSERWKTQFEEMYPRSVFGGPAYAILGNHDYQRSPESKVEAELAYAKKAGTRWTMPSQWYRFEFPAKNPAMTVIALDSNMPHADGKWDFGANFTMTPSQQTEQLAWLTAELEKPLTTPFLVVMGHHPIFSNGPHGDHPVLTRDWEPLLQKHKVHLYLAGHDHDLQHLEFEGHPTSFVSSGGGGADLYNLKIADTQRGPMAVKVYGFSHLEASRDMLTLRHVDESGRLIHAFTKTPDGQVKILS